MMSSKREVYYSYVPLLCSFDSLSYKHAFDHIRWFEWWDQVRDILRLGPQFEPHVDQSIGCIANVQYVHLALVSRVKFVL